MTSISMAASSIASSPLHKTNSSDHLFPNHSPQPQYLLATAHSKLKLFFHLKPLKLTAHQSTAAAGSWSSSLPRSRRHPAAAFDNLEVAEDETLTHEEEEEEEEDDDDDVTVGETEGFDGESEEGEINVGWRDEGRRLYVGNLPYTITSAELKEVFSEAGGVSSVEIIYDRVTDRSRGFGFVTMATVDEGKSAIQMFNGAQIGGRTIRVNLPEVPKGGEREIVGSIVGGPRFQGFIDSPHKLYAANLSWSMTSEDLKQAFAKQPGYLSAKVVYERDTGRSRGFGFVSFETAEDVDAAVESMNGVELAGRPLRLNSAIQRPPIPRVPEFGSGTRNRKRG